jgi:hypothetical protein
MFIVTFACSFLTNMNIDEEKLKQFDEKVFDEVWTAYNNDDTNVTTHTDSEDWKPFIDKCNDPNYFKYPCIDYDEQMGPKEALVDVDADVEEIWSCDIEDLACMCKEKQSIKDIASHGRSLVALLNRVYSELNKAKPRDEQMCSRCVCLVHYIMTRGPDKRCLIPSDRKEIVKFVHDWAMQFPL